MTSLVSQLYHSGSLSHLPTPPSLPPSLHLLKDGNAVTFSEKYLTTFNDKASAGSAADQITIVNPAWHQVRFLSPSLPPSLPPSFLPSFVYLSCQVTFCSIFFPLASYAVAPTPPSLPPSPPLLGHLRIRLGDGPVQGQWLPHPPQARPSVQERVFVYGRRGCLAHWYVQ